MSTKTDGGPAFGRCYVSNGHGGSEGGMTLRDWFAGQALAGLLSDPLEENIEEPCSGYDESAFAKSAYRLADAMLKERAK